MELASSFALCLTAIVTIGYSATIAYSRPKQSTGGVATGGLRAAHGAASLSCRDAALFPLYASVALLFLYFLMPFVSALYVLLLSAAAYVSLTTATGPLLGGCGCIVSRPRQGCTRVRWMCGWGGAASDAPRSSAAQPSVSLASVAAALTTSAWVVSGHWLASNAIGCAMCVTIVSQMRLPSLRVAALALIGLLFYDVVWVFLSPLLFQESVMMAVAQQDASNPVSTAVNAVPGLREALPPSWLPAHRIALPNKIAMPVWLYLDTTTHHMAGVQGADASGTDEGDGGGAEVSSGSDAPMNDAAITAAAKAQSRRRRSATGAAPYVWWLSPTTALVFVGFTFLGLGDIALPGLLLAYARGADLGLLEEEVKAEEPDVVDDTEAAGSTELAQLHGGRSPRGDSSVVVEGASVVDVSEPLSNSEGLTGQDSESKVPRHFLSEVSFAATSLRRNAVEAIVAPTYLRTGLAGYAVGLVAAMTAARVFDTGQPALLYIVPATLIALMVHARRRKQLYRLWVGPPEAETSAASASSAPAAGHNGHRHDTVS